MILKKMGSRWSHSQQMPLSLKGRIALASAATPLIRTMTNLIVRAEVLIVAAKVFHLPRPNNLRHIRDPLNPNLSASMRSIKH